MWKVVFFLILITFILYQVFLPSDPNSFKPSHQNTIQTLVRQTARWGAAARQDASPLIAVLHANYAAGYLWALKDIATPEDIKKATGFSMPRLEKEITAIQDWATKRMARLCPEFVGDNNKFLAAVAGEG